MLRNWLIVITLTAQAATAIELDQLDTFQDGTTQSWAMGHPDAFNPLTQTVRNDVDCGESGDGDNCLRVFATGATGPGSKLATFNLDQWTGDYITAGVAGIRIRARNFSSSPQSVRLRIMLTGGGFKFISKDSISVPFNSIFNEGFIRLTPATLNTSNFAQAETLLRNVDRIWILHQPEPQIFDIPSIQARVYIDDILAVDDSVLTSGFEIVESLSNMIVPLCGSDC